MAFTAGEITNIANAALDFYLNKGDVFNQTIQARPLLAKMEAGKKTFPGGKGSISAAVKGVFGAGGSNDTLKGYTHDDQVGFFTPANILRVNYPWREHHIGLTLTHTELKIDGISVVDTNGERTSEHSRREMHVLVNLLEDKLFELGEQYARSLNALMWGDGGADAKAMAGIQYLIVANPAAASTPGGLSRVTYTWWRNRARTAANGSTAVTSSPTNGGALVQALQQEYRQLIRYGGKPTLLLAGSDFINAMEIELRANGYYTQTGFKGSTDMAVGPLSFMSSDVQYDPTLDDLGFQKRAYWIDTNRIKLYVMEDEWRKEHSPARPADKFVLYRSLTSTGQMVATQMNSSLVIDIL